MKLVGVGEVSILYGLWYKVILPDRLHAEWPLSAVFDDEEGDEGIVQSATE